MRFVRNDPLLKRRRLDLRENQTETEKAFWSLLRNRQFKGKRFFRQYSMGPYILFFCPESRLAIELDGGQHIQNREYDIVRSEWLKTQGIEVMRFWNNDVLTNGQGVLNEMASRITPQDLLIQS